jgi:superfamily II DNA or RNA helicase
MRMRIRFDRGTLVLEAEHAGEDPRRIPGATWDDQLLAWRFPAEDYKRLIGRLADLRVRIADETRPSLLAGDWRLPPLRWYQHEALEHWEASGCRGVLALPTGSGKTVAAIAAIAKLQVATLVLVPTRVLLDQWARSLAACWPHPIGRLGDGDHQVLPITVATYASAVAWAPRIGDRFGLVVVDEAHHVGAWCASEIFEMLVAPARLGLTATPPDDTAALIRHVGPIAYARRVDELTGDGLSEYDLITIPIPLTRDERTRYRENRATFSSVYAPFQRNSAGASWGEFVRAARQTRSGREALAAWRGYRALLAYPDGKRTALRELLARHRGQRTLVFTSDNATAYAIARELLVMPITHEISRAERTLALDRFRSGEISVLVSSHVLDEGLDVPDADIAIVVGGSASKRRHIQRIGRVLRPRDHKRARVYELAVEETTEVDYVKRRRAGLVDEEGLRSTRTRIPSLAGIGGAP